MSIETVGFIGLGRMGEPMAARLAQAGFNVRGYRIKRERESEFRSRGIIPVASARAASQGARFVVTMLPDTADVEDVMFGANGIMHEISQGQTFIDMSTISPIASVRIAEAIEDAGAYAVDAPVSGGVVGAQNGTLSIMAGGRPEAFNEARGLFDILGRTVRHMGPSGSGQATKLCNQIVVALNLLGLSESFALGAAMGLNLSELREVLTGGAAGSWVAEHLGPLMLAGDDSPGFRIALQLKDLRLAIEAASVTKVPLPATLLATSVFTEAVAHNEGSNGNQSVYRVYERLANRSIARVRQ